MTKSDFWGAALEVVLCRLALATDDAGGHYEKYPSADCVPTHTSLDTIEQGKYQTFLVSMMTRVIAAFRD
ncbi:MAG TPA: hypothetical protein VF447_15960 [Terriglobales bacterium]